MENCQRDVVHRAPQELPATGAARRRTPSRPALDVHPRHPETTTSTTTRRRCAQTRSPRTTRHWADRQPGPRLFQATASGGDDLALDALLVRFSWSPAPAARGSCPQAARHRPERSTVLLREKNDKDGGEQPVSPSLIRAVLAQACAPSSGMPSSGTSRARTRSAPPLTRRRFNTLTNRWQATLPGRRGFRHAPRAPPHRHWARGERCRVLGRAFARHQSKREVTTTYP